MGEHKCEAIVYERGYHHSCGNKAKYHEAAYLNQPDKVKWFCGIHAPSQIELRRQKKKDDKKARHDKLHSDPEFIKSQISLCKARIEAHERELAEWEAKLEAVT